MSSSLYPPNRPLAVGEILDLALQIFRATAVRCLPYGLCAVIAQQLPNIYDAGSRAVRQPFGGGHPVWVALFIVGTLLSLVAWSALLLRQRAIIEHASTSTREELAQTLRRFPVFVVATLLVFAAVGCDFAVFPLIPVRFHSAARIPVVMLSCYLAVLLSCTWPAVLLTGQGSLQALGHSVQLVWGNWWRVAATYGVGAVALLVLSLFVGILVAMVVPALVDNIPVMTAVFTVLANALIAVIAPFVCALVLAVFGDLRARKEGVDLQQRIVGLAVD